MKTYSERRRLERKRKASDKLANYCEKFPQIPQPTLEERTDKYRGRVIHVIVRHDDWCPAYGTGVGCTCNPVTTYHLQPLEKPQ